MKTCRDYLDDIKRTNGITSDYALAKTLGVNRSTVSGYRASRRAFDNATALKVAEILKINPIEVIAAASAEHAKTAEEKKTWENFMKRLRGVAASFAIIGVASALLAPVGDIHAASIDMAKSVYYVKCHPPTLA